MAEKKSFDYRTHVLDPRTGKIDKVQTYKITFSQDKATLIERPIGSGYFYNLVGELVKQPAAAKEQKKVAHEEDDK